MSHFIVLLKQVPDISKLKDDVFDPETGILIRSRLDSVVNELDDQALSFALNMKKMCGSKDSKLIALTMGPPQAESVIKHALFRGVDEAILLSDRVFGGADTYATAHSLSMAIKKIQKEFLNGSNDVIIVSGMQSVDGDTAQVPPQIASALGIFLIPYASQIIYKNGEFFITCCLNGHDQTLMAKTPCVITVSDFPYPLFPTFEKTHQYQNTQVNIWTNQDIGAEYVGLRGSKTQVVKVFPSLKPKRICRKVQNVSEFADHLIQKIKESHNKEEPENIDSSQKKSDTEQKHKTYQGDVWVVAEVSDGKVHDSTFELLTKAKELSKKLETQAAVCVLFELNEDQIDELSSYGAKKIIQIHDPLIHEFDPKLYTKVIGECINQFKPQIALFSATGKGRVLAPLISYELGCGLTADCTGLDIGDFPKKELYQILIQTRPALGGNIMASIISKNSFCQMATVRPGVMQAKKKPEYEKAELIRIQQEFSEDMKSFHVVEKKSKGSKHVDFKVDVIVSGGMGLKDASNHNHYIESLIQCLDHQFGVSVQKGASRRAVEHGFIERDYQVGQTGTTVNPHIYIALGISGAIQHMIGVERAGTIFSINNNLHAPIFEHSDYYIVGDVEKIVPELIQVLKEKMSV